MTVINGHVIVHRPPLVVYIGACRVDLPSLEYQPSF